MSLKEMVPWRWGGLRRWDEEDRPFESFLHEMNSLHREMDRLFDEFWKDSRKGMTAAPGWEPLTERPWSRAGVMPRVDASEDEANYRIRVELPGMDKDDVDITLENGMLTVRGEKKLEDEEKGKDYFRRERSFGAFRRSLPVPAEVDEAKIEARFEKGVLTIDLPKSEEAQRKVTHIDVNAA